MKDHAAKLSIGIVFFVLIQLNLSAQNYPIVDSKQTDFFDSTSVVSPITSGSPFYGQDANYQGNQPSYTDNGDGTITDNITGLIWQKSADINGDGLIDVNDKLTYLNTQTYADTLGLAGYTDWRMPTIKELYSLILFNGLDISGPNPTVFIPFIDTAYFDFGYGDENAGERLIDAQYASSTLYVGLTMSGDQTLFGVNFADGRIKGYGLSDPQGGEKLFCIKCVRGGTNYGINQFQDNLDGTITDQATGLTWTKDDNGSGLNWEQALSYAENSNFAGHTDWRLPNIKELQSIIDYTRCPSVTNSPAIDTIFNCSSITDEGGNLNYPFYWSSTTHANISSIAPGGNACYLAFGNASGWMQQPPMSGNYTFMDVHGAGAQRSDPKTGDPSSYPYGHGPQGDVIRIFNYVRLVRGAGTSGIEEEKTESNMHIYPNPVENTLNISFGKNINEAIEISVFDLNGKLISQQKFKNSTSVCLNVSGLGKGIYMISARGQSITLFNKFIKM